MGKLSPSLRIVDLDSEHHIRERLHLILDMFEEMGEPSKRGQHNSPKPKPNGNGRGRGLAQ